MRSRLISWLAVVVPLAVFTAWVFACAAAAPPAPAEPGGDATTYLVKVTGTKG